MDTKRKEQGLLTREEAAKLLGLSPYTLSDWARTGRNLCVVKLGRSVRYRREDIDDLIRRNTRNASIRDEEN
jgi:excisionase family DNA binding protein